MGCAGLLAVSPLLVSITGCSRLTIVSVTPHNGIIRLSMDQFLPGEMKKILRTAAMDYDVLLVRKSETEFYSLLLKCTHQANRLSVGSSMLACNLHGSTYDMNGRVINGPASTDLITLRTEVVDAHVLIYTPS